LNEKHIDHLLTQHRRHLAHQRLEPREPCRCETCQREAFEHRAVMVALGLVLLMACFAWVYFLVPA
jgi:hypothetical protein